MNYYLFCNPSLDVFNTLPEQLDDREESAMADSSPFVSVSIKGLQIGEALFLLSRADTRPQSQRWELLLNQHHLPS